jgi:hypothetical protein
MYIDKSTVVNHGLREFVKYAGDEPEVTQQSGTAHRKSANSYSHTVFHIGFAFSLVDASMCAWSFDSLYIKVRPSCRFIDTHVDSNIYLVLAPKISHPCVSHRIVDPKLVKVVFVVGIEVFSDRGPLSTSYYRSLPMTISEEEHKCEAPVLLLLLPFELNEAEDCARMGGI